MHAMNHIQAFDPFVQRNFSIVYLQGAVESGTADTLRRVSKTTVIEYKNGRPLAHVQGFQLPLTTNAGYASWFQASMLRYIVSNCQMLHQNISG